MRLKAIHILIAVGILTPLGASAGAAATVSVKAPRAKLVLTKHAAKPVVRAGKVTGFTLAVTDRSVIAAGAVKVCDRVPALSRLVAASRRVHFKGRNACFKVGLLGPGERVRIKVSLLVQGTARGTLLNTATATARNARRTSARATVRIASRRTVHAPVGAAQEPSGSGASRNGGIIASSHSARSRRPEPGGT